MSRILVSPLTAMRIDQEKAEDRRRTMVEADEKTAAEIKAALQHVVKISCESSRESVKQLCTYLMNRGSRRILPEHRVTLTVMARLVSDALLGEGVDYEVKC